MKISVTSTTYTLSFTPEQKKKLSNDKKLIWPLRRAVYSSVKMSNVTLDIDNSITFTLYRDEDNPTNHKAIQAAAQRFFEANA